MKYTNVTNPQWANAEQTTINCVVDFEGIGLCPFSAVADGDYEHTHEIFARCVAGDFGPIAAYIPPAPPTTEQLAYLIRSERNRLLSESDWTQLVDVPKSIKDTWAVYRQALRDVPQQAGFPDVVDWPSIPN